MDFVIEKKVSSISFRIRIKVTEVYYYELLMLKVDMV